MLAEYGKVQMIGECFMLETVQCSVHAGVNLFFPSSICERDGHQVMKSTHKN